ncbi:MAG: hypothetical protein QOJ68_1744 [Blastococcus sp.]|jgi:hypothetical protein|nr:hypothetical protein [Blastococcus sp.]
MPRGCPVGKVADDVGAATYPFPRAAPGETSQFAVGPAVRDGQSAQMQLWRNAVDVGPPITVTAIERALRLVAAIVDDVEPVESGCGGGSCALRVVQHP